jgi:hypothetical protein
MAISANESIPVYGQSALKPNIDGNMQDISETFQVSATANNRRVRGPTKGGRITFHFFNETASGATSALTIGYSNLPNPDVTNDNHWVDSGIAPIVMTTTATGTIQLLDKVYAQWVRFKPTVVTSAGKGWLWVRTEGTQR